MLERAAAREPIAAEQIVENVGALQNLVFSDEELSRIDGFAKDGNINLWARSSKD